MRLCWPITPVRWRKTGDRTVLGRSSGAAAVSRAS
jgi:hypothetical protein